ncbi:MAG TPA: hypothetical protein VFY05_01405 [Candidatus Angelobacter sp.]|nr:hypothetical protein [Candidatus Angelobacter sp.]
MKRALILGGFATVAALSVTYGAQKVVLKIPKEAGLYTIIDGNVARIEGQAVSFHRSGSLLVSGVTAGIKTAKINVQILGRHADQVLDADPTFYYRPPAEAQAIGQAAGDLIMVRLQIKHNRRQIEVGARGLLRGSNGVSLRWQVQTESDEVTPGIYRIRPMDDLRTGEYAFYVYRGEQLPPYLYPFSIEGSNPEHKRKHKHIVHL